VTCDNPEPVPEGTGSVASRRASGMHRSSRCRPPVAPVRVAEPHVRRQRGTWVVRFDGYVPASGQIEVRQAGTFARAGLEQLMTGAGPPVVLSPRTWDRTVAEGWVPQSVPSPARSNGRRGWCSGCAATMTSCTSSVGPRRRRPCSSTRWPRCWSPPATSILGQRRSAAVTAATGAARTSTSCRSNPGRRRGGRPTDAARPSLTSSQRPPVRHGAVGRRRVRVGEPCGGA
jgi:hypothetical protein